VGALPGHYLLGRLVARLAVALLVEDPQEVVPEALQVDHQDLLV